MGKILQVRGLTYSYGNNRVLDNIDLTMEEGDFLVLFGEDDAGKTTLLRLLMGFDPKFSGNAKFFDMDANSFDQKLRRKVRFVPDDILWEQGITGENYLNFVSAQNEEYNQEFQKELCEKYEIPVNEQLLNMTYRDNKMVQLIAAISAVPKLLILDEPVNFLDMKTYRNILGDMQKLQSIGVSVLIAAEKYADARDFCNCYAYIKDGKLVCQDKVAVPEYRWKIVIVRGGRQEELEACMEKLLFVRRGRAYYLYRGEMKQLPEFLRRSGCMDCVVEEMTLEEEINQDFSRWEEEAL